MEKRVTARGIIIDGDSVYAMYRKKTVNGETQIYYVMPGGGVEDCEDTITAVIREIKEEFSVDVKVEQYLGILEREDSIIHFYVCDIISGIPKLGGEELDRCNKDNYYEVVKVKIEDIHSLNIMAPDLILKVYKMKKNKY